VLFPLLSQGERLFFPLVTPVCPVAPVGNHKPATKAPQPGARTRPPCHFCAPQTIPPTIVSHGQTTTADRDDSPGDTIPGLLPSPGTLGGRIPTNTQPVPPPADNQSTAQVRHSVSEMQQMAQLIRRVEPNYPPLARQIQREGRVELHAIISTAGSIESLEVISGDPLFIQSALSAVREWRYRPTILNGRPIEVDTHITVIYTLSH
jgi:TonB family protein